MEIELSDLQLNEATRKKFAEEWIKLNDEERLKLRARRSKLKIKCDNCGLLGYFVKICPTCSPQTNTSLQTEIESSVHVTCVLWNTPEDIQYKFQSAQSSSSSAVDINVKNSSIIDNSISNHNLIASKYTNYHETLLLKNQYDYTRSYAELTLYKILQIMMKMILKKLHEIERECHQNYAATLMKNTGIKNTDTFYKTLLTCYPEYQQYYQQYNSRNTENDNQNNISNKATSTTTGSSTRSSHNKVTESHHDKYTEEKTIQNENNRLNILKLFLNVPYETFQTDDMTSVAIDSLILEDGSYAMSHTSKNTRNNNLIPNNNTMKIQSNNALNSEGINNTIQYTSWVESHYNKLKNQNAICEHLIHIIDTELIYEHERENRLLTAEINAMEIQNNRLKADHDREMNDVSNGSMYNNSAFMKIKDNDDMNKNKINSDIKSVVSTKDNKSIIPDTSITSIHSYKSTKNHSSLSIEQMCIWQERLDAADRLMATLTSYGLISGLEQSEYLEYCLKEWKEQEERRLSRKQKRQQKQEQEQNIQCQLGENPTIGPNGSKLFHDTSLLSYPSYDSSSNSEKYSYLNKGYSSSSLYQPSVISGTSNGLSFIGSEFDMYSLHSLSQQPSNNNINNNMCNITRSDSRLTEDEATSVTFASTTFPNSNNNTSSSSSTLLSPLIAEQQASISSFKRSLKLSSTNKSIGITNAMTTINTNTTTTTTMSMSASRNKYHKPHTIHRLKHDKSRTNTSKLKTIQEELPIIFQKTLTPYEYENERIKKLSLQKQKEINHIMSNTTNKLSTTMSKTMSISKKMSQKVDHQTMAILVDSTDKGQNQETNDQYMTETNRNEQFILDHVDENIQRPTTSMTTQDTILAHKITTTSNTHIDDLCENKNELSGEHVIKVVITHENQLQEDDDDDDDDTLTMTSYLYNDNIYNYNIENTPNIKRYNKNVSKPRHSASALEPIRLSNSLSALRRPQSQMTVRPHTATDVLTGRVHTPQQISKTLSHQNLLQLRISTTRPNTSISTRSNQVNAQQSTPMINYLNSPTMKAFFEDKTIPEITAYEDRMKNDSINVMSPKNGCSSNLLRPMSSAYNNLPVLPPLQPSSSSILKRDPVVSTTTIDDNMSVISMLHTNSVVSRQHNKVRALQQYRKYKSDKKDKINAINTMNIQRNTAHNNNNKSKVLTNSSQIKKRLTHHNSFSKLHIHMNTKVYENKNENKYDHHHNDDEYGDDDDKESYKGSQMTSENSQIVEEILNRFQVKIKEERKGPLYRTYQPLHPLSSDIPTEISIIPSNIVHLNPKISTSRNKIVLSNKVKSNMDISGLGGRNEKKSTSRYNPLLGQSLSHFE